MKWSKILDSNSLPIALNPNALLDSQSTTASIGVGILMWQYGVVVQLGMALWKVCVSAGKPWTHIVWECVEGLETLSREGKVNIGYCGTMSWMWVTYLHAVTSFQQFSQILWRAHVELSTSFIRAAWAAWYHYNEAMQWHRVPSH